MENIISWYNDVIEWLLQVFTPEIVAFLNGVDQFDKIISCIGFIGIFFVNHYCINEHKIEPRTPLQWIDTLVAIIPFVAPWLPINAEFYSAMIMLCCIYFVVTVLLAIAELVFLGWIIIMDPFGGGAYIIFNLIFKIVLVLCTLSNVIEGYKAVV